MTDIQNTPIDVVYKKKDSENYILRSRGEYYNLTESTIHVNYTIDEKGYYVDYRIFPNIIDYDIFNDAVKVKDSVFDIDDDPNKLMGGAKTPPLIKEIKEIKEKQTKKDESSPINQIFMCL